MESEAIGWLERGGHGEPPLGRTEAGLADLRGLKPTSPQPVCDQTLSHLDLSWSVIRGFRGCEVAHSLFRGATVDGWLHRGFSECDFSRAKLKLSGVGGHGVLFDRCKLDRITMGQRPRLCVLFRACSMRSADLRAHEPQDVCFERSDLTGARFGSRLLSKYDVSQPLRGVCFFGCQLEDVQWNTADPDSAVIR